MSYKKTPAALREIKGLFLRGEGYHSTHTFFLFFFLVYFCKAARVARVGGLPYLRAKLPWHAS